MILKKMEMMEDAASGALATAAVPAPYPPSSSASSPRMDRSAGARGDHALFMARSSSSRSMRVSTISSGGGGGGIETPGRRKSRPDSPLPVDSPRALSVRSVDLESLSSTMGWGSASVEEETRSATEAYFCQVCLEDRPAASGFLLSSCGHTFCRACLKGYVTSKVNDGQVYPACFHDVDDDEGAGDDREGGGGGGGGGDERIGVGTGDGRKAKRKRCSVVICRGDVEALLASDRKTRRKFARFLFCREHETARECPRCGKLQVGDPLKVEMRCSTCRTVFCYEHGGAHEGKTCAEYVESTADETGRTLALIRRLTKPCPGCHTPVEKLGGCNQMICYHCSASFCWICGQEVDRGTFPVHFQWWNVRGCPNQQLQEDTQQAGGGRQCHQILSILQIIIVGPPALALTIASSLACLCCLPAFKLSPRQLFTGCFSGWGNLVMMLPILPFVLAGAAVAGLVYLVLLPFRLGSAISRKYRLGSRHGTGGGLAGGSGSDASVSGGGSGGHSSHSSRSSGRGAGRRVEGGEGQGVLSALESGAIATGGGGSEGVGSHGSRGSGSRGGQRRAPAGGGARGGAEAEDEGGAPVASSVTAEAMLRAESRHGRERERRSIAQRELSWQNRRRPWPSPSGWPLSGDALKTGAGGGGGDGGGGAGVSGSGGSGNIAGDVGLLRPTATSPPSGGGGDARRAAFPPIAPPARLGSSSNNSSSHSNSKSRSSSRGLSSRGGIGVMVSADDEEEIGALVATAAATATATVTTAPTQVEPRFGMAGIVPATTVAVRDMMVGLWLGVSPVPVSSPGGAAAAALERAPPVVEEQASSAALAAAQAAQGGGGSSALVVASASGPSPDRTRSVV